MNEKLELIFKFCTAFEFPALKVLKPLTFENLNNVDINKIIRK
jgi:hypothetical protein